MKRTDWLLVLLRLPGHTGQENEPMDRLRIIKTLFLLGREMKGLSNFYDFRPYLYGPFSLDIYRDLDKLLAGGYVRREATLPITWSRYWLTSKGIAEAEKVLQELSSAVMEQMKQLKGFVTGLSFTDLLKHVYSRYPEYAKDSVINVS